MDDKMNESTPAVDAGQETFLTLGAYGGLADRFHGNPEAETAHYRAELASATAFLKSAIHGIQVESFVLNFEGAWVFE